MKVLIIQQKRIGDVLVGTTLCNNLRKCYPSADIHYLIYDFTHCVVDGNPNINKIILFNDTDRSPQRVLKFALGLRKQYYDTVIDVYSKGESLLFSLLSGARRRISHERRYGIYNVTAPTQQLFPRGTGEILNEKLSLLTPVVGTEFEYDPKPRIFLAAFELEQGKRALTEQGIDPNGPIAMFGIFGSVPSKSYPSNYMRALIDWYANKFDHQLALIHFPEQMEAANEFAQQLNGADLPIVTVSTAKVRNLAACMSYANRFVGNDCGLAHIAKALDVPAFTIFSPSIPKTDWGILDNLEQNQSVDIGDFFPEEIAGKTLQERSRDCPKLYSRMRPELIIPHLEAWAGNLTPAIRNEPAADRQADVRKRL